ncbi:YidB family protein [Devosia sp. A16]|uniref:YidB family protein n=1 Tax=Devosia sp. A16 TaxID=1736675 RepID=UPI0006D78FE1|nr:YidB family protein [Devosia sp. A16]
MANRTPSLLALLGLLAVAGYQNRDKIGEALKGLQGSGTGAGGQAGGLGGMLGGLGDLLSGNGSKNVLSGGLGDLLDTFRSSGQKETADSWVTPGVPTKGLSPDEVATAIGEENLAELSQRTGLSREDLLKRLATAIPETVDKMTPDGRLPDEEQARGFFQI